MDPRLGCRGGCLINRTLDSKIVGKDAERERGKKTEAVNLARWTKEEGDREDEEKEREMRRL